MNLTLVEWSQIASGMGTLLTTIIAAFAAYQSVNAAKENRDATRELTRPRVSVSVKSTKASKNLIDLVVLNTGRGIAKNVNFELVGDDLDVDEFVSDSKKMSGMRALKLGIKTMSADEERRYYILSLIGIYKDILKKETKIKVNYTDETGKPEYKDEFVLDFASLSESGWVDDTTAAIKNISKEMTAIKREITKLRK